MKSLSEAAVRQYRDLGYYAPVPVLTPRRGGRAARAGWRRSRRAAARMQGAVRHKPHLLFTWLNDLIRHPRILDAVEDIIGPDILCWGTSFFIKEARNPASSRGTRIPPIGAWSRPTSSPPGWRSPTAPRRTARCG